MLPFQNMSGDPEQEYFADGADAFAGQLKPAQKTMTRLLQINPGERVSNLEAIYGPYRRADDAWRYGEGLRRAGLPE